jgi:hypothetical protein
MTEITGEPGTWTCGSVVLWILWILWISVDLKAILLRLFAWGSGGVVNLPVPFSEYKQKGSFIFILFFKKSSIPDRGRPENNFLFCYRCNQLPLIEKLPQWLSGPSSPLSVTAGPLDGYRTRFK